MKDVNITIKEISEITKFSPLKVRWLIRTGQVNFGYAYKMRRWVFTCSRAKFISWWDEYCSNAINNNNPDDICTIS